MNELDQKIRALQYAPEQLLALNGDAISNYTPVQTQVDPNGKYIVIHNNLNEISGASYDISVMNAQADTTYPGALLLANRRLAENNPDSLLLPCKPITLRINLPGMTSDGTRVVEDPSNSNVSSAINELLNLWQEKYSKTHSIVSNQQYTESMVHSESQVNVAFGCNIKHLENALNLDFSAISRKEKSVFLVRYQQIFYTVSVDLPVNPSDLISDEVTWELLSQKGVNNQNPPVFVSNVAYGRSIFIKLETDSKDENVEAAFKSVFSQGNVNANAKYTDILNQTSFTVVSLGGNAEKHSGLLANGLDNLRNIIRQNATYSIQNPGYPLCYKAVFLKDGSSACVNSSSQYITTTRTEYSNGELVLEHTGGYVAKFNITWEEVKFDQNGKEFVTTEGWKDNGRHFTAKYSTVIPLSGNCRNIRVKAEEATGLVWEPWRTVIDTPPLPLIRKRVFKIYGTTLNPQNKIEENT